MPPKGYSAVPTDEPRDSTDVESRTAVTTEPYRDEPDECETAPSDSLLPDSTDCVHRQSRTRSAVNWFRNRPRQIGLHYRAFRKAHSGRSILLAILIGFLLASTTALAISTGILGARVNNRHDYYHRPIPETRIPWNWDSGSRSSNFNLDLPSLYPPLAQDSESSCKSAWNNMRRVSCHEKVLNRAWDNGKQLSMFEPRYDLYAQAVCGYMCVEDLQRAHQTVLSQCTQQDLFDTSEYLGPFTADPGLEPGPIEAIGTLLRRVQHTCRKQPAMEPDHYGDSSIPCAAELYQDWFVVDGMNTGNLHGLEEFLKRTQKQTDQDEYTYHSIDSASDQCDDAYPPWAWGNSYWGPPKKRGPSDGATTCSWCLINWFDRKLQSWEKDDVLDPVNSSTVSLPDYLHRIEKAGRRCQAPDWNRIYTKNIRMYQEKGWLSDNWEDEPAARDALRGDTVAPEAWAYPEAVKAQT